jgi:hypothetical protein
MRFLVKLIIFFAVAFLVIMIGLYTYAYFSPKLDLKTSGSLYLYDNNGDLLYQGSRS